MIYGLIGFAVGGYVAMAILLLILGADPEGRFKARYALFWPFYLKRLFYGP